MTSPRALALASLAALAGCASSPPRPVENVPVFPPVVTLRGATVSAFAFEGATVDVALDVENPNTYALPLVRLSHAVEVDGVPAFSGEAPGGVAVASRGTSPVAVRVFLPYARVPDIADRMRRGQPIAYRATGAVGFRTPAGIMDLPVSWEGTLPVPRPPTFTFEGLEVGALGAMSLSFDVRLRVANHNAFNLPSGQLGHRLAVAGSPVASGDEKIPRVGPGGTASFKIPAHLNVLGAGAGAVSAVYTALSGSQVPVALEGVATVGGVPFDVRLASRLATLR